MKLAVVAFPTLEDADRRWIESFRAKHDPQVSRIDVHLTLVFPVVASPDNVLVEVAAVAQSSERIAFTIRRTEVIADAFGHGSHVVLALDEGPTQISTLHDRLYAGTLKARRRSDIPFVPHMTVGAAADSASAIELAKQLDVRIRTIRGAIEALELLDVGEPKVRSIGRWELAAEDMPH